MVTNHTADDVELTAWTSQESYSKERSGRREKEKRGRRAHFGNSPLVENDDVATRPAVSAPTLSLFSPSPTPPSPLPSPSSNFIEKKKVIGTVKGNDRKAFTLHFFFLSSSLVTFPPLFLSDSLSSLSLQASVPSLVLTMK